MARLRDCSGYISCFCLVLLSLAGCVKDPASSSHPLDPYEKYNRRIFAFNSLLDQGITRPIALTYHFLLPPPLRVGVSNAYNNVGEITSLANHLLQGNLKGGLINANRFIVNTVFGICGLFDVASRLGLHPANTSFLQTLTCWGARPNYYLVLPLFGPTSDCGAVGLAMDSLPLSPFTYLDNFYLSAGIWGVNIIQKRDKALAADEILSSSFDPYLFMRDAYFQSIGLGQNVANESADDSVTATDTASHQSAGVNAGNHRPNDDFDYVLD